VSGGLKRNGRGSATGPGRHRLRVGLVVSQVALVVILLSGAGLLTRSFWRLSEVDPGFRPEHLVAVDTMINGSRYTNGFARIHAVELLLDRLARSSDTATFAAVDGLPLDTGRANMDIALTSIDGNVAAAPDEKRIAGLRLVSPGYFGTMGIPLQRGRAFTGRDTTNATPVVIINEALARRYFPAINPLGERIGSPDFGPDPCEVVGVVADVRQASLDSPPMPEAFRPLLQQCFSSITLVARGGATPDRTIETIRKAVAGVDPGWPVYNERPVERLVTDSMASRRFTLLLMELFAGLALVMAVVGVYGVLSCVVGERRREIAIRLAVGAQRHVVFGLVLGQGMRSVATGALFGLIGAFMLTRVLRSQLFGVSPTDPLSLCVATMLLVIAALLACWLPARRASKVDPMEALRHE
jgi:putative ABC transport system permease protein